MAECDETARMIAWHREMTRVHARLREALDVVRDAAVAGREAPAPERELLLFCHGFCHALSGHHAGEDHRLFPALLRRRPDLADVVRRLEQDHSMIEHLLHGLRTALDGGADGDVLERHLDGVSAVMESHFRYEERKLLPALEDVGTSGLEPGLEPWQAFGPLTERPGE